MKKTLIIITMLVLSMFLYSCDDLTSTEVNSTIVSTTEASTTLTTTTQPTTTQPTTTEATTTAVDINQIGENFIKPTRYNNLQDELTYVGIPSIGSPKILVFCVDFPDSKAIDQGLTMDDMEKVFNGTSDDLDFESLNSYYLKSSYGKLNLTADLYGFYTTNHTAEYYEEQNDLWNSNDPDAIHPESDIVFEVLSYYDDQIDYSDYDSNGDGCIDGLYIIYSHDVSFDTGSDLWWAWQTYYMYYGDYFDGVEPLYLCWAGSEFITSSSDNLDARTVIHETGHMMGLDDYYDYDTSDDYNSGGLGSADMMDGAVGDHGPFSKLMLGWITPIVVESSSSVDLLPYIENGDVVLIIDEWNNTIFDEYLLVSFYTPDGLYAADSETYFCNPGLTIYHVNAELDPNASAYYTPFKYNNTDSTYKVVEFVEANTLFLVSDVGYVDNNDIFEMGDTLGDNVQSDYTWNNGDPLGFDIEILSLSDFETDLVIVFE